MHPLSVDTLRKWLWTVAETCRSAFVFRNWRHLLVMNLFTC